MVLLNRQKIFGFLMAVSLLLVFFLRTRMNYDFSIVVGGHRLGLISWLTIALIIGGGVYRFLNAGAISIVGHEKLLFFIIIVATIGFLINLVSQFTPVSNYSSSMAVLLEIIMPMFLATVICNIITSVRIRDWLLQVIFVITAFASIISFLSVQFDQLFISLLQWEIDAIDRGIIGIRLETVILIVFPFVYYSAIISKKSVKYTLMMACYFLGLLSLGFRMPFLIILLQIILISAMNFSQRKNLIFKPFLRFIGAFLVIILFLFFEEQGVIPTNFVSRFQEHGIDPGGRLERITEFLSYVNQFPSPGVLFGMGVNTVYSRGSLGHIPFDPHFALLITIAEIGIIGLLLFIGIFVVVGKRLEFRKGYQRVWMVALLGFFVQSMVQTRIWDDRSIRVNIVFWLITGLLMVTNINNKTRTLLDKTDNK